MIKLHLVLIYLVIRDDPLAKVSGKKVSQVIREALKEYIEKNRRKKRRLSFVGIGKSGQKDVSETYEEKPWNKERCYSNCGCRTFSNILPSYH